MSRTKQLFAIHGWVGLVFGLMLSVICFSGAVAVLSHEFDRLLNPDIRVEKLEEPVAWSGVLAGARHAFPTAEVSGVSAPLGSRFAAQVGIKTNLGQTRRVYVHPQIGDVQGHTSYLNIVFLVVFAAMILAIVILWLRMAFRRP